MHVRRRKNRERGASLVEFALIVPILAMFLFGIVQFGLAYDAKQSINSAAREGARYAALQTSMVGDSPTSPGIKTRAQNAYIGAGSGTPTVNVYQPSTSSTPLADSAKPCENPTGNQIVAVVAEIPHIIDIPFVGRRTVTITARAEFRCE